MSWQNRSYASEDDYRRSVGRRFRGSGMSAYDIVTKIIIANIVVYLFHHGPLQGFFENWLIMQPDAVVHGQVWRMFTATYMHAGFWHIFINMLVLYFFGPLLEHRWGQKQFFIVYSLGGIFGNVVLTIAWLMHFIPDVHTPFGIFPVQALGASGSVMTIMAAGATYYPTTEVLVYFLLPLQLRTVVIIYALGFVWNVYNQGPNFGGDICHLGGLVVGWWWARTGGWAWASGTPRPRSPVRPGFGALFKGRPKTVKSRESGDFRSRVAQRQADAATVDRILAKVADRGIHSLTDEEKATLKAATERLNAHQAG
ncbi:MAG TPA: rhomboid family intramembrane serine protease [Phycisphaerae bacterium]|nr:rhomboid family intramembrane serine protease [Phycisphaerae bacterium]